MRETMVRRTKIMSTNYCVIVTSYSKAGTGSKIIKVLLAKKRAACIQVLPIKSFYTWRGRRSVSRENLMLIKARSRDFEAIKRLILENHDYEVPEIISLRIHRGSAGYLNWMDGVIG
jgi:periplasmic divalent cation tolerance protein